MICRNRLPTLLLALAALIGGAAQAAGKAYTVAVVPQYTPVDTGRRWTPFLERLEQETGVTLQLRLTKTIPEFETEFMAGLPDIVYLNPYHAVMARKARGYEPFLRGEQRLSGVLVVDGGGPIKSLADLNGKRVAFPSPNAFGASLYLRALLKEREKLDIIPDYVGTHQNVYLHVLLGQAAAGGGVNNTLERESASARARLKVLYATPSTPPHPLAAHPRVPAEVRAKIADALLELQSDARGSRLLEAVELEHPVRADYARDYAPLEALRLERYVEVRQ